MLYNVLGDEFLLSAKLSNFAYNVAGPRYTELHALFKKEASFSLSLSRRTNAPLQYECCIKNTHLISVQLREFGLRVPNVLEVVQLVRIEKPQEGQWPSENDMLKILLRDHEHIIQLLRNDIEIAEQNKERAVEDFLVDLLRSHKKMAYCVRSQLEAPREPSSGRSVESD